MIPVWMLTGKAKLIAGGLLLAGLYWWHQHEIAKVYSQAVQETTEKVLQEQAEAWSKKQADFNAMMAQERDELEGQWTALAAERKTLDANRGAISRELKAGISQLAKKETGLRNEIQDIPDTDVVARYRLALQRARNAEAARPQP